MPKHPNLKTAHQLAQELLAGEDHVVWLHARKDNSPYQNAATPQIYPYTKFQDGGIVYDSIILLPYGTDVSRHDAPFLDKQDLTGDI